MLALVNDEVAYARSKTTPSEKKRSSSGVVRREYP